MNGWGGCLYVPFFFFAFPGWVFFEREFIPVFFCALDQFDGIFIGPVIICVMVYGRTCNVVYV